MTFRRLAGLSVFFIVAALALMGAIRLSQDLLKAYPTWPALGVSAGLAGGVALALAGLAAVLEYLTRPPVPPDPRGLILKFNRRTLGVVDEETLAQATGDVLAEELRAANAGWLLLTPHEAALTARPVPARGDFPALSYEITRQNALIRHLSQRHELVRQTELEADTQYGQTPPAERQWLKQLGAVAYAPVFEAGLLTAVLAVGPREGGLAYRPADLDLIALLAAQAGAVWRAIRLQSEVRQLHASLSQLEERLRATTEAVATMDSSRSDFLAIASHELRTPITQLLGFADLLGAMAQDNSLDAETISHVTDSIVRACGRLNEVISQIMDMAQLDVNALDLKFKAVTLDQVLRQAIEPYVPAMRERRLALRVNGYKDLPGLEADEHRLVQAFGQLMSNAIKYTPDGGKIELSLRHLPAEAGQPAQLEVVFADGGIGIDPQYQPLIFNKFFRIGRSSQHSTSTTKFMGAGPGLGLPIAKGVIERHGGRLWVESEGCDPARLPGSRFYVRLPLKPPAFDPRALTPGEAGPASTPSDKTRDSRPHIPRTPFVDM